MSATATSGSLGSEPRLNHIPTRQNLPENLQRLGAQRHLYSVAKAVFNSYLLLAGPLAVSLSIYTLLHPEIKLWTALFGLSLTIADVLWLTPWQKRLRDLAARIQDAFDCDVLEMDWEAYTAGKRADPEEVIRYGKKYRLVERKMPTLMDWYPPVYGELPISVARAACQRANCAWDAAQRHHYALALLVGVVAVGLAVVIAAVALDLGVIDLLQSAVLPLAPVFILAARQYREHRDAVNKLQTLKDHANKLFDKACSNPTNTSLVLESRALQNQIHDSRKRSPVIFDWIFRILRPSLQQEMEEAAAQIAKEAKEKLGRGDEEKF